LFIIAFMLRWKIFRYKSVTVAWFIIMCVLFFLPGSDLPQANWMDAIYVDKLVHIGLFAILTFLCRSSFDLDLNHYNWMLLLTAIFYGLAVEFIQKYCIPNRSFDLFDLLADTAGSILGLIVWLRYIKK
jgi:VanZ family protein